MAGIEAGLVPDLRDVLAHLRRRRLRIGLAALAMAGVGLVLATILPRLYTATAEIMVDPRGLRVFDNEVVPGGQISDVQSALVETQSKILKSDSVLQPVVDQERLADDPEFNGSPQNIVSATLAALRQVLGNPPPDPAGVALANLADAVKVQRLPSSFVIELSVAAKAPATAARLATAITETFIAKSQTSREESSRRVSEGLAMRLDALGAEVKRAETAVDTFKRENNIVDANGRPVNEQQLGDLTNQSTAARVHTDELRARYEQIQRILRSGAIPDATSEVIQSPSIQQLRTRYAEVKQLQDNLLTSLGPRHPSLLAANAQVEGVKALIRQEIGRIAASARSDYERAKATQEGLSGQLAAITQETGTVNTAAIRLRELERDAQARRAVYESFLTRSRETREQSDLPTVNISVISPAAIPLKPGGIPAILVVAIVAAFGASGAALLILAFDHMNGRLLTPRQMSLATGLPMLAIAERRASLLGGLWPRRRAGAPPPLRTSARSLQSMRQALDDVVPDTPPRIVLLLSATPLAAQARLPFDLACAACATGDRVLLIDADGDRLTRPFDGGPGADRRGWTPIRKTSIPNLSVLAWSGPFTQREVRGRSGNDAALLQLAADQDFIFVHGSVSDAAVRLRRLAEVATNIVLIIDADTASIAEVDGLRREIGPLAYKVDGFVWVSDDRAKGRDARAGAMGQAAPAARATESARSATRTDAA